MDSSRFILVLFLPALATGLSPRVTCATRLAPRLPASRPNYLPSASSSGALHDGDNSLFIGASASAQGSLLLPAPAALVPLALVAPSGSQRRVVRAVVALLRAFCDGVAAAFIRCKAALCKLVGASTSTRGNSLPLGPTAAITPAGGGLRRVARVALGLRRALSHGVAASSRCVAAFSTLRLCAAARRGSRPPPRRCRDPPLPQSRRPAVRLAGRALHPPRLHP